MSILHNHYAGIAKLDGVEARNEEQAQRRRAEGFPAKKALQNYNKLGGAQHEAGASIGSRRPILIYAAPRISNQNL